MKKYIPSLAIIKFIGFIILVYMVVLTILTHIPEILAICVTMGVVHWLLKSTAKDLAKREGGVSNDASGKV